MMVLFAILSDHLRLLTNTMAYECEFCSFVDLHPPDCFILSRFVIVFSKLMRLTIFFLFLCNFRTFLDQKVQKLVHCKKHKEDIHGFIVVIILVVSSFTIFGAIVLKNETYLTSQDVYLNGHNNHRYFAEIQYSKEFLEDGCTNLWSSNNSLGYPLFVTTQLLPNIVTSSLMIFSEK